MANDEYRGWTSKMIQKLGVRWYKPNVKLQRGDIFKLKYGNDNYVYEVLEDCIMKRKQNGNIKINKTDEKLHLYCLIKYNDKLFWASAEWGEFQFIETSKYHSKTYLLERIKTYHEMLKNPYYTQFDINRFNSIHNSI